ncbi:MAG: phosphatidate cytidylyltransferase [Prevotella sp.]|nr:phosphatidate cytidylyltransferase [Prevotella sp.]
MNTFIVRSITGILFVAVMLTCFLRPLAMVLLFTLITGMTIWEFTGLVNAREDVNTNRFICTASGVFLFIAIAGYCWGIVNASVFIPYLLTIVYLFISELYTNSKNPLNDWAYSMMSQMYVALPLACINVLAFRTVITTGDIVYNMLLPMSIFIFLWMNDTGAYLTGSMIGRHKLFPRISPGKTWEGSIGGGVLVLIVAALIAMIDHSHWLVNMGLTYTDTALSTPEWMGLGLTVVFFGTWGDLVESLFKRTLGIKDSGKVLPGHGGMLDRFDSSLMALPAAVIYVYTITLAGI